MHSNSWNLVTGGGGMSVVASMLVVVGGAKSVVASMLRWSSWC